MSRRFLAAAGGEAHHRTGHHQPGDVLDSEVIASDRLHVSRTAYREALRMLAAKGLVESRPKTGTRVSQRSKWHLLDPDVLSWIFEFEPDDEDTGGVRILEHAGR